MNDMPDLQVLESVGSANYCHTVTKSYWLLPLSQIILAIGAFTGACFITTLKPRDTEIPLAGMLFILCIGIIIWFINTIRADFYWETSPEALFARGYFCQRSVR